MCALKRFRAGQRNLCVLKRCQGSSAAKTVTGAWVTFANIVHPGSKVHYWSSRKTRGASQCARPASFALFPPSPQCVKRNLRACRNARLLDSWPTNRWRVTATNFSPNVGARMRLHPPACRPCSRVYCKTKKTGCRPHKQDGHPRRSSRRSPAKAQVQDTMPLYNNNL